MAYTYNLVILSTRTHRFIEHSVEADGMADAFGKVLSFNPNLMDDVVTIYCRKPKSGDLQLMGSFDGLSWMQKDGIAYGHILKLSNGTTYTQTEEGFRQFFI